MNRARALELLWSLVAGLCVAVGLQAAGGWWLDSGFRVVAGELTFVALGVVIGCVGSRQHLVRLVAVWLGVQIGLTGFLFWMGPGTIWPLTVVIGGVLSAGAIAAGGGTAHWLTRASERSG